MTESVFASLMFLMLAWAVVSRLLGSVNVTGAQVFLVAGYLLANPSWGPLTVNVETESIDLVAELTLALLLFSDAARVNLTELRKDVWVPVRLLGVGLPLSLILGTALAAWMFDDFTWAMAGFVGAALAATDAALSAQVINDERVPLRLRRALNVESGLNDGIAAPIVVFMLAVTASQLGTGEHGDSVEGNALLDLVIGILIGTAAGLASATLITLGSRRQWIAPGGRRIATLATALGSFSLAVALDGNGFIAAFVAGIAFGNRLPDDTVAGGDVAELPELVGELLALAVWFLFGAAVVPIAFDHFSGAVLVYALLSLTVVRMIPVALSLVGAGLDRPTVVFVGWFGPRGLASMVFALLAIEQLPEADVVGQALSVVTVTVLSSVVLHGLSAGPLGRRYVLRQDDRDHTDVPRSRRLGHHGPDRH